jgi:hypothetical protein
VNDFDETGVAVSVAVAVGVGVAIAVGVGAPTTRHGVFGTLGGAV